jgi:tRNA threonylcarbamoyladenosine biosynthesis protein TsaB
MLICAIDTSGRDGSLALAEADDPTQAKGGLEWGTRFQLLHSATIAGGTYSAQLIPTLSTALAETGKRKSDIGLLAVASGPGSFTGLRVGLSTVKALAEVLSVPVIAISVLEAIAFSGSKQGLLITALDAQRNEVFVGEFEATATTIKTVREALVPAPEFVTWLRAQNPVPCAYTPDGTIEARLREAGASVERVARPTAEVYARLGLRKYLAGQTSAIDELDANYIRRSDAEILSAPKLGIKTSE